jgi:hypothetical protein
MQVHLFIALTASAVLHKAGTASFNLHTASGLLLNMLDICTTMTNNLSTQVEAWDRLKANRNSLFWPFALEIICQSLLYGQTKSPYTTELVSLNLLWLSSPEPSFINKIWQFLLHQFIDFLNGLFESGLGRARNVQIKRWVL